MVSLYTGTNIYFTDFCFRYAKIVDISQVSPPIFIYYTDILNIL